MNRIGVNGRVFGLAATVGVAASAGSLVALAPAFLLLSATAAVAIGFEFRQPGRTSLRVVEGGLVGLTIAAAGAADNPLYLYLIVPPLMAGLMGGATILAATLATELVTVLSVPVLRLQDDLWPVIVRDVLPWFLTAIAFGLLGARSRRLSERPSDAEHDQYVNAHELLGKLRIVSRRLTSGLDPVVLAEKLLDDCLNCVQPARGAVLVRADGGGFTSLARQPGGGLSDPPPESLLLRCWTTADVVSDAALSTSPVHTGGAVAVGAASRWILPLRVGTRMVGVLALELHVPLEGGRLRHLQDVLSEGALPLEAALLFDDVRSLATVEERQRLAREIHDGVAQEIASLGYLVDDLALAPDATRPQQVAQLRERLTRIVDDLRLSIFDLRSQVGRATSLGSILGDYLREFGARSGTAVHFSLHEAPERLRLQVEEELLRIVQEAVTNARKHSGARHLWVTCRVRPPGVVLIVEDDGSGIDGGAERSRFGLSIMAERARRIGGTLEVGQRAGGGTCVAVRLAFADPPAAAPSRSRNVGRRSRLTANHPTEANAHG